MQWNETPANTMPPTTETQAKLIGTWQVTVTFYEGPLQGQSEMSQVIFAPDHTFLILLLGPGPGSLMFQMPSPSASRNCSIIVLTERVPAT